MLHHRIGVNASIETVASSFRETSTLEIVRYPTSVPSISKESFSITALANLDYDPTLNKVMEVLSSYAFDLSDEKELQAEISAALLDAEIEAKSEFRLSARDTIDFYINEIGVGIECKLRQQKMAIYRQLKRYAKHERIRGLVLVTNTSMGLPELIESKPVYAVSLGTAWLMG